MVCEVFLVFTNKCLCTFIDREQLLGRGVKRRKTESGSYLRPNPKSLIAGIKSRLWHRVHFDSGIGLPNAHGECV
jgi:hypothetical protein